MSAFDSKNIFTQSLEESRLLLARFIVLYRMHSQKQLHGPFSQFDMIHQVIGPGLRNLGHACYITAFLPVLFHMPPLRLLILAWPNSDPIVGKLRGVFAHMGKRELTNAISLEEICEPHFLDAKDCFELAL
jgi:hypothetical protein